MLTPIRKVLGHHAQAALSSLSYLCRQPMSTGLTVIVIALTLTLPALLWVLTDNLSGLASHWKQGGRISLYLDTHISNEEAFSLLKRVQKTAGVGKASLHTPDEALAELERQEGMHDLLLNLPENPLPAVIDVTPAVDFRTSKQLDTLYGQLKSLSGIEEVRLDMQWVSRLYAVLAIVERLTHGLMLLLALGVVLIVANTLRLVIHKRHDEIQVLKLVGATDPYILRPFLYLGLWYGLASALVALSVVLGFIFSLSYLFQRLVDAYQMHFSVLGLSARQALSVILVATLLGWLGALIAVKRQLTLIEPV